MPFDSDDPRLTAFALGELEPADRDAIEAILRDDPDGRAFVVSIEDTARLLAEELRHESSAVNGLASSHRDTIERSLAAPILAMTTAPAKRTWIGRHVFEIAAAASLIGVGVGLMLPARQSGRLPSKQVQLARAEANDAERANLESSNMTRSVTPGANASKARVRYLRPGEVLSATDDTVEYRLAQPGQVIPPDSYAYPVPAGNRGMKARLAELEVISADSYGGDPVPAAKPASAAVAGSTPLVNPPIDHRLGNRIPVPMSSLPPLAAASDRNSGISLKAEAPKASERSRVSGQSLAYKANPDQDSAKQKTSGVTTFNGAMMPGGPGGMGGGMMGGKPGAGAKPAPANVAVLGDGAVRDARFYSDTPVATKSKDQAGQAGNLPGFTGNLGIPFIQGSASQIAPYNAKTPFRAKGGVGPENEGLAKNANVQAGNQSKGGGAGEKPDGRNFFSNPNENAKPALGIDKNGMLDVTRAANSKGAPDAGNAAGGEKKPSEPQPVNLAINDGDQQRINALQGEFAHKEAELQQLNEQAEGFRRRVIVEQAKVDRETYARLYDNPFTNVVPGSQLSTFAVDVDTASYANVRRFLVQGQLPLVDAVRIEEMVNYFTYDDPAPTGPDPFSVNVELAACPWDGTHRLARIGLKGKTIDADKRPPSNLVFLIDVSGSMNDLNKLPMLKAGMKLLVGQLTENDRVAIVTYANGDRVALPSTPCHRKDEILAVLDGLSAGGGTNGGAGVQTAYKLAQDNFIKGGTNRVILATDGDFNLGLTKERLLATSEERAKSGIFLSVLGFGQGNIQEEFMEQLADKGNGNYSYIDTIDEARRVLVTRIAGTLVVIAKDVKVQVEFNPDKVSAYRLIGYENRVMANEDFRNDKKDAGEIGAGHSVTALYEIVPSVVTPKVAAADRPLKYVRAVDIADKAKADADAKANLNLETLTVYLRYKQPDGDKATEFSKGVTDDGRDFGRASTNLKFASAVAGFGMILRESPYKGSATLPAILEIAGSALGDDKSGDRKEFLELVKQAERITAPQ